MWRPPQSRGSDAASRPHGRGPRDAPRTGVALERKKRNYLSGLGRGSTVIGSLGRGSTVIFPLREGERSTCHVRPCQVMSGHVM